MSTVILRVHLGRRVDAWPLSRAQALATRRAREDLDAKGLTLEAPAPEWTFEPREGDTGAIVYAVATVAAR